MKTLIILLLFSISLFSQIIHNQAAFITSQCYTKTVDTNGKKHNPCYSCHTNAKIPNYMSDEDIQESYAFAEYATKNRWTNLFKDRTNLVQKISDKEILDYIKTDNYKNLKQRLQNLPKKWDLNHNGSWDGYLPDCYFNFDTNGFDRDEMNNITGWVAFKYRPFLGTFWPTNGSTDDVLIRLPKIFWLNSSGKIDLKIYTKNLIIVEDLVKQTKKHTSYMGLAKNKKLNIALGLYPVGTEFLHSVRYIQPTNQGVELSKRMKELRYAKKVSWSNYWEHQQISDEEFKEKHDFPDRLSTYIYDGEYGISNKRGWFYQGFIEDKQGELRPQNHEETLYCIGCHASIGAITDSTFAYPRKYAFGYWDKKGVKNVIDKNNEYLDYLKNNNHANEFRTNEEVYNKFFKNGKLKLQEANKIKSDISYLLVPSKNRALLLNKAYKIIVDEQSFIYGRDTHVKPLSNVYQEVKQDESTQLVPVTRE